MTTPSTPSTIHNVRLFDGERLVSESGAIRLAGGVVTALGAAVHTEPGDTVIDGAGGTVLPGLIDSHVHLLPGSPAQALSFGVTTILDMFSKQPLISRSLTDGSLVGRAGVLTSGVGASAPGGHPSMMYAPFPTVSTPAEAASFVADRRAEGAAYLKLMYEGGQQLGWAMPSLDLPTVRALVRAAHDAGLPVVAHIHAAVDAVAMADCGVDVLAHVPIDPLSAEQRQALAAARIAVISTLSVADGLTGDRVPLLERPALAARLGPAWTGVLQAQTRRWRPPQLPSFDDAMANVAALHRAGVRVLAGTDAPNPGTVTGASLHRELELLVDAGLSAPDALAAATGAAGHCFPLGGRGRLAVGAPADVLLVSGRPDARITDSANVTGIWKAGVPQPLDDYVGSADETAGIDFLRGQTQRVIDAVRQRFPGFTG